MAEDAHDELLAQLAELRGLAAEVEHALARRPHALTPAQAQSLRSGVEGACGFLRAMVTALAARGDPGPAGAEDRPGPR